MTDLTHFIEAQAGTYDAALAELRAGKKRTHWMWFVFPQIAGLGRSPMAQKYVLHSLDEAHAYLSDPTLGPRLRACTEAVLTHPDKSVHDIFGSPDDLKFHSSITLFHRTAPNEPLFRQALDTFFGGGEDAETLKRI